MKSLFATLLVCASLSAYTQVVYQEAHIINENGEKIFCFIKNVDWLSNPDKIQYKLSPEGEVIEGFPSTLKEFQVKGFPRYVSDTVNVDMSSVDFRNLSDNRNPIWEKKIVFLREVVSGKFVLYAWINGNMKRFFFAVDNSSPEQLIHKQYHVDETRKFAVNNSYRQQLYTNVKCDDATQRTLTALKYDERVLAKYFVKVNECHGIAIQANMDLNGAKQQRRKFNLSITPGMTYSSMKLGIVGNPYKNIDLKSTLVPRIGLEAEFIFGFHRNKWSVFIEPSYHSYKDVSRNLDKIDYSAIEFPIGVRHYFYFKNDLAAFANVIIVPFKRIVLNDVVKREGYFFEPMVNTLFGAGAGLSKGRFKVEARLYGVTDVMGQYPTAYAEWKRYLFIAGFRIVKK